VVSEKIDAGVRNNVIPELTYRWTIRTLDTKVQDMKLQELKELLALAEVLEQKLKS
jgi:hypothetical protein